MNDSQSWITTLREAQATLRLTAGHRYQRLNSATGKWEYVDGTTSHIPKDKRAVENLCNWAASCVAEEAARRFGMTDMDQFMIGLDKAHERARDSAAGEGTHKHRILECEFRRAMGEDVEMPPMTNEQARLLEKFRAWVKDHNVRPVAVECMVYNPILNHAGTIDLVAYYEDGEYPEVLDYKRNKIAHAGQARVFFERKLQNIAYRAALMAMCNTEVLFGGRMVYYPREGCEHLQILDRQVDGDPADLLKAWGAALELSRVQRRDEANYRRQKKEEAA